MLVSHGYCACIAFMDNFVSCTRLAFHRFMCSACSFYFEFVGNSQSTSLGYFLAQPPVTVDNLCMHAWAILNSLIVCICSDNVSSEGNRRALLCLLDGSRITGHLVLAVLPPWLICTAYFHGLISLFRACCVPYQVSLHCASLVQHLG